MILATPSFLLMERATVKLPLRSLGTLARLRSTRDTLLPRFSLARACFSFLVFLAISSFNLLISSLFSLATPSSLLARWRWRRSNFKPFNSCTWINFTFRLHQPASG